MKAYAFIVNMVDHASSGLQNIARSAGIADDRMENLNREANKSTSVFGGLKGVLATVFTVVALTTFTNRVIDARAEYEKFKAVLTNTFQSADVGEGALNMLTDFAAKTPFALNELTGSFVKLVNRGFNPTMDQLTKMGDLAASQGKGFDQLTEAVLDAQTGEFERLKEFGIKASKAGDKITMSFKGTTKEVANNEAALRGVLLQYGDMVGVAGSMDAISKTLGGRISNLSDNWNTFLVAVGGEGNSVLTGFVDLASKGIAFLTDHLPQISKWFEILWSFISPVVDSLREFVKAAFGFTDAGSALETFGAIMSGVLLVVDWFTTGLITVIDMLMPFADIIGVVTAAWALFNLMVAISPLGWVVIAILAIVAVIGMVTKYTDGWSTSWQALSNIFKAIWSSIKSDFEFGVQSFKFGFKLIILSAENAAQKIIGRFSKVGEAISMALDGNISGAWDKAFEKVDTRAESEMEALIKQHQLDAQMWKQAKEESARTIQNEIGNIGITVDTEGASKDFQAIKDKFNGIGKTSGGSSAYDDYLGANSQGPGKSKSGSKKGKLGGDTIVSGGTRKTNIYVTIQKLQDDTKIYVSSKEEGLKELGDKVQEVLLRSINSINQMQTG